MRSIFIRLYPLFYSVLICGCIQQVEIWDGIKDEGKACYQIKISNAVFLYQQEAGGFSSIIDKDGNDWVDFHPDSAENYPRSAASSFRGLPNLVFRSEDGGAGHPGFNKCESKQITDNSIQTISKSGLWVWSWNFYEKYAVLEVEKSDPDHAYWFLYEGIPGGEYQPHKQYWGTDKGGPNRSLPDYFLGNTIYDTWQWAYFGHEDSECILFIAQEEPDELTDIFGYLGNSEDGLISPDGMVVFGLGRERGAKPLMTRSQKFVIGFLETKVTSEKEHKSIEEQIDELLKNLD